MMHKEYIIPIVKSNLKLLMLKSRLCDHSDAYILVKGTMTVPNMTATAAYAKNANKNVIFKNCVPFTNCISETNNTQIDNAEDSDVVILMETLIEYSNSYLKTSGILWQYCRDESAVVDDGAIVNVVANNTTSSFKIKGKKNWSNQQWWNKKC